MKQLELLPDTAKALNELAKIKGKTPQELANEIITNYVKKNKASNTADYFNHIPFDDECEIDFCSNFVITGEFTTADRNSIEASIYELGGNIQERVNGLTEYVVVGQKRNSRWNTNSCGRKIYDALNKNLPPIFISEARIVKECEKQIAKKMF